MPWKFRRELYLIILGCTVIALSIIVIALNQGPTSTRLLGIIGLIGGLTIVVNLLPSNGDAERKDPP